MKRIMVVLDEPWDSALTDLGVKIAYLLKGKVACAVLKDSPAYKRCLEFGLSSYFIKNPRKSFPLLPFLSLKKALENFKPNVVITIRGEETLFASLLKKRFSFKLYRIHGEAKGVKNSFLNRWLHRNFVDGVLLSSVKLLNEVVLPLKKIFVRGVVDTRKFSFTLERRELIRRELGIKNSFLLGIIGRLDPVKGHDLFIKALSIVVKNFSFPVYGLVVGEEKGVKLRELKLLAESLKVEDRLIFVPKRVSNIVDYICACDLGVVTSKGSEVIARVPLEFMSCERPVVTTNVGVLSEVVKPQFGVVTAVNELEVAKGILRVLTGNLKEMGMKAREEVDENYSFSAVGRIVNTFFV